MPQCEVKHIRSAVQSILSLCEEQKCVEKVLPKVKQLSPILKHGNLAYCLDRYIGSEFDTTTKGSRGLGRMTVSVPRLGAYYRKQMSALPIEEIERLYLTVQDIILRAYFVRPLFVEKPLESPKILESSRLFELWIPVIYTGDSPLSESVANTLETCEEKPLDALQSFLTKHKMEQKPLFSGCDIDEIVFRYLVAGYYLRIVETDKDGQFSKIRTVLNM